jgi:type I restriction enzyme S subunit
MRKYDSYKESGIYWFKEIPRHWSLLRLKDISKALSSGATPSSGNMAYYENGSINWLNTGDLNDGLILETSKQLNQVVFSDYPNLKIQKKGTLVIAMYGATIGKMGILNIDATTNQACCCVSLKSNFNTKFFFYQLLNNKQNIISLSVGGTQPNVSQSILGFVKIPTPPFLEQTAIAQYLDTKTQAIDKKVNLLEKKIGYFKELRKSIINETVTKGLDKTVKLKDSGIDWIGQIPELWEVKRIKDLSTVKRGASPRPIDDPIYFDDQGEYSWVRISDLTKSERYLEVTKEKLSVLGASLSVKRYPNDFILSIAGTVGKPIITKIKCCIHDGFVWFPELKINAEFLYYLFSTGLPYQGLGKLGTQLNLNTETIGFISLPIPSNNEIEKIIYYLDHKTQTIDKIVGNIQNQISTLIELRKTLINDVVTGKIKVVA